MKVVIYGIKSCNTMQKAFTWLEQRGISYHFHDYKKQGIDAETVTLWLSKLPLKELINTRGTTWRKLDPLDKETLSVESALPLILKNTSLLKRPLLSYNGELHLGFNPEHYAELFKS